MLHQAGAAFMQLAKADYEQLPADTPESMHVAPRMLEMDQEFSRKVGRGIECMLWQQTNTSHPAV